MIKVEIDGVEQEVFTAEEMAAKEKEAEDARAESAKHKRVADEQTQNFKRFHDMTEEEKQGFSEKELQLKIQLDKEATAREALEKDIKDRHDKEFASLKEKTLASWHRGDAELQKKLEENWLLVNVEGTDENAVTTRARLAARMSGINTDKPNPIVQHFSGDAPALSEKNRKETFLGSDRAKAAMRRIGMDPDKKPEDK